MSAGAEFLALDFLHMSLFSRFLLLPIQLRCESQGELIKGISLQMENVKEDSNTVVIFVLLLLNVDITAHVK